jgi:hypothetical protein
MSNTFYLKKLYLTVYSMHEFPDDWFSQVESTVIAQYTALKVKGDIDNSVLAAFVLADSATGALRVIALGTGTKVLSGDHRSATARVGPCLLHDCHAEVLAHRALQCWIWANLDSAFANRALAPSFSLHFYSSTPPCGDCCVHEFSDAVSVQTGAKPFGWEQSELAGSPPRIVRGKPGRGSRSQSVSCSDKLCLWLNVGFEGFLLSEFVDRLTVQSVCIGDGNAATCARAFYQRVGLPTSARILIGKTEWQQKNESPSAASFVWWQEAPRGGELISAKCGRRMGVIEKRQEERKQLPITCDAVMIERYCLRKGIGEGSLRDIKSVKCPYAERKVSVKTKLLQYGGEWAMKFDEERAWKWRPAPAISL